MSSELHCTGQKSVLGESAFQTKNVVDGQSYSSRRSSLEQMADHIFAESQHAAGNDSPVISRHSASSNALRRGNQHMDREFAEHCIKENSCKRLVPCYLQGSQKQGHHSHENRVSSSAVSIRKDDYHPSDSNRQHESISTPKVRRAQQLLQSSYPNTDMVPERTLPKFGDWDAMDPTRVEFTVIFDKARNERKFSMNQERPITKEARAQGNEDLYESSSTRRRNVLWTLVCCSPVSLGGR
ncbi:hypothetical protein KP509_13G062200 [Ceratopteris richardii]|nr:hypothetical protein KP509_13G062200 [Ceratopteris richardii]